MRSAFERIGELVRKRQFAVISSDVGHLDELAASFTNPVATLSRTIRDADDFLVFRNGVACQKAVYECNKDIDWNRVERLFISEGCTLYCRNYERHDKKVYLLCREINRFVSSKRVFANLFVTPPLKVGLPVHYDLTDFLVIQLRGTKRWDFWRHPEPAACGTDRAQNAVQARSIADNTDMMESCNVSPGTLVFVPTPTIHRPLGLADISIHLTVGFLDAVPALLNISEKAAADQLDDCIG